MLTACKLGCSNNSKASLIWNPQGMRSRQLSFPERAINYFHVTFSDGNISKMQCTFPFPLSWRIWNTINLSVMVQGCRCEPQMLSRREFSPRGSRGVQGCLPSANGFRLWGFLKLYCLFPRGFGILPSQFGFQFPLLTVWSSLAILLSLPKFLLLIDIGPEIRTLGLLELCMK